jgi:hypothetical protein
MKILLGDFNAKVGRENIFKPTIGNESPHQDSNDNERMEELKRLSQSGFQECFQHLHSVWQKRIVPQGSYFEGNLA